MIPIICVGCKNAKNNQCTKKNYCIWYRLINKFTNNKYWVPNKYSRYSNK